MLLYSNRLVIELMTKLAIDHRVIILMPKRDGKLPQMLPANVYPIVQ